MKIVVAGMDGCHPSNFFGLTDMFRLAQRAIHIVTGVPAAFEVTTASADGRPFVDGRGRACDVDAAFEAISACNAIIVPGFAPDKNGNVRDMSQFSEAIGWMRRHHARGTLVGATCSAVFLLGEAGLLDGRRCTTTWWNYDELRRRYPRIDAVWAATLIEDQGVITTGGWLSWVDLALHMIRTLAGPEAARITADYAVVDTAPSTQAAYIPADHLAASDRFLIEAEHQVRRAQHDRLSATKLAWRLGVSVRTLNRRLERGTGESARYFIERIRFETAKTLLETSSSSVKQLAAQIGYLDETSFRRAFLRHSGMTPGAYRQRAQAKRSGRAEGGAEPN